MVEFVVFVTGEFQVPLSVYNGSLVLKAFMQDQERAIYFNGKAQLFILN